MSESIDSLHLDNMTSNLYIYCMNNINSNISHLIITKLQLRLNRELNQKELQAFKMTRSTSDYEMMLEYVSDKDKSSVELEQYSEFIVKESSPSR